MAKTCCVCSDSKESPDNRLFRCGGQGCGITVHQACYGITSIPTGLWFCRKCESQERAARVKCELCPKKDGALKRTDGGNWAHIVCALYIPEVTFGNLRAMEPIITTKLPKERFSKSCYICEELGQESQASNGACMSCHKTNCRLAFHVTCAQKEQLLVEEEDPRDSRNIIYCGYCNTHHKKMMKQKLKQLVYRKQPVESVEGPINANNIELLQQSDAPQALQSSLFHAAATPLTSTTVGSSGLAKGKDKERFKRTSSDAGLSSSSTVSTKRKYRRRKLSSSNESSTSEAQSSTNEAVMVAAHNMPPPVNNKKSSGQNSENEKAALSTKSMDCGNLDLLASVTENFDQVDRFNASSHDNSLSPSHALMFPSNAFVNNSSVIATTTSSNVRATATRPSNKDNSKRSKNKEKENGRKQKSSSSSSNQKLTNNSIVAASPGPPLSLHELLERQWEQTAQFILDQAGRQNNAGVMLAHLHELQSENRTMQARIMELASQREFFIATNARLRQTLNEGGIGRVLNGIQLLSSGGAHPLIPAQDESQSSSMSNTIEMEVLHEPAGSNSNINDSTVDYQIMSPYTDQSVISQESNVLERYSSSFPSSSYLVSTTCKSSIDSSTTSSSRYNASIHNEVTHVTNSVQGPITAYTGFPDKIHQHSTFNHS